MTNVEGVVVAAVVLPEQAADASASATSR
jgi:hypothetical protein